MLSIIREVSPHTFQIPLLTCEIATDPQPAGTGKYRKLSAIDRSLLVHYSGARGELRGLFDSPLHGKGFGSGGFQPRLVNLLDRTWPAIYPMGAPAGYETHPFSIISQERPGGKNDLE